MPDIELTKINTLAVGAIFLGTSHFIKFKIGERKMPPPIPTMPDKKPMAPPNALFFRTAFFPHSFILEIVAGLVFIQSKIAAIIRLHPRITKKVF